MCVGIGEEGEVIKTFSHPPRLPTRDFAELRVAHNRILHARESCEAKHG